jgi:hypothetical protein
MVGLGGFGWLLVQSKATQKNRGIPPFLGGWVAFGGVFSNLNA